MLSVNYCNYNFSNPDYDVIDRPCGTDDYLFLYFQTPMKIRLNGQTLPVRPGACILIPPNTPTYYYAVRHFTNSFVHFCGPEAPDLIKKYPDIPLNHIFYPANINEIHSILKEIYIEATAGALHFEEKIHHLICELFIAVSRQLCNSMLFPDSDRDLYETFGQARLMILTHPEKNWNVSSMAALTSLGSSQFYEYYRKFFNASPKSELLNARLELASYLLSHETFSVAVVAQYCGFSNLPHFTRYFKAKYGCTPGAFRHREASGRPHERS